MKIFSLLVSCLCLLSAMEEVAADKVHQKTIFGMSLVAVLAKDSYTRVPMHGGGAVVTYKETGYPEEVTTLWDHNLPASKSESLRIVHIGPFDRQLFLDRTFKEYTHVIAWPEDRTSVLLRRVQDITRTANEHRYLGGSYTSTLEFSLDGKHGRIGLPLFWKDDPFRIYANIYTGNVLELVAWVEGREEVVLRKLQKVGFAPTGNETCKKGNGKPWTTNPTGQGSRWEQPKTEAEILERARALFPEFTGDI